MVLLRLAQDRTNMLEEEETLQSYQKELWWRKEGLNRAE